MWKIRNSEFEKYCRWNTKTKRKRLVFIFNQLREAELGLLAQLYIHPSDILQVVYFEQYAFLNPSLLKDQCYPHIALKDTHNHSVSTAQLLIISQLCQGKKGEVFDN